MSTTNTNIEQNMTEEKSFMAWRDSQAKERAAIYSDTHIAKVEVEESINDADSHVYKVVITTLNELGFYIQSINGLNGREAKDLVVKTIYGMDWARWLIGPSGSFGWKALKNDVSENGNVVVVSAHVTKYYTKAAAVIRLALE